MSSANDTFLPLLIGQMVISCGFIFLSLAITLLANKWHTDKEREVVIAILGVMMPAGNLVAFVWTGIAFRNTNPKDYPNETELNSAVFVVLYKMLFEQAIVYTVSSVPFIIFIKSRPENPPSLVATKDPEDKNFC